MVGVRLQRTVRNWQWTRRTKIKQVSAIKEIKRTSKASMESGEGHGSGNALGWLQDSTTSRRAACNCV